MAKARNKSAKTRIESDAFGPLKISANRLWGAQTQRSLHNFRIGTERVPIEIVRALGVRRAFDFRGLDERASAACGLSEITVHSLPIEPTVVAALRARLAAGTLSASDAQEIMRDSYRNYVRHDTESFRKLFAHLLHDSAPLVMHCTAGKDRTGFACALVLHALGVPDEAIGEDYLLTNRFYRSDASSATDLPDGVRQAIGSVEASFLAAGFDTIRADYGDLESYFRNGLGLAAPERNQLRSRYLQA